MLSKTHGVPVHSPAPGVIPDTVTGPLSEGRPSQPSRTSGLSNPDGSETRGEQLRRKLRGRLHAHALVTVAPVAFLIALAASNTAHVKVNWVFGSSHVSLVWLVLFTASLG
jgi:hypothetical protein